MSNYIIVPGKIVDAMLKDLQRERRKSQAKKICLLGLIISIVACAILLSGCYTTRALYLGAQCGVGRDYVCSPQSVEAGETNNEDDNEVHIICGCMNKEDLKGN